MKRILAILFTLALAGTHNALALGLGGAVGQETVHMDERRKVSGSTASDLAYSQLDVKFNTLRFSLLDFSKPMGTGLYSSSKSGDGSFWNRPAAIGDPEHETQWLHGSSSLSYIMGSSSGADEILVSGGSAVSPAPASTNSFWGIDLDMGLGQYQFLKLPLELSMAYDAQFRSYTFTNVYDGAVGKTGETGGMSVNGYVTVGADLGIIPGLVVSGRVGYDPIMSVVSSLYPDLISPGYEFEGGAEWMPLKFLSVYANYAQYTTGFFGLARPSTISDTTIGARLYFY